MPDVDPVFTQRLILALNIQRQRQMVADAGKLLKLAQELNDEVARSKSSTLTRDQLSRIYEIEKLAHKIRQSMINGSGSPVILQPSPFVSPRN